MKCLLVINPFSLSPSLRHKVKRIEEELIVRGIQPVILDTIQLRPIIKDSAVSLSGIQDCAFCIYLDKDKYLARLLENFMPVYNSAKSTALCDDKTTTFLALLGTGIRTPKTIPAPLCYSESDQTKVDEFLSNVEHELGFPLVAKHAFGSLGKQVFLIRNRDELSETYTRLQRVTHLYQEYIGNDTSRSSDYRAITVGGKALTAMRRINENDFRSNISCGGRGEITEDIPETFIQVAELASRHLELDIAGVDMIPDQQGNPVLLEVNSNPFLQEVERVTGINIASAFVEHCIKKSAI